MQPKSQQKNPLQQQQNNGFLIVASLSKFYYVSAINLANSILDFYPEAKITLCTEPELFEEQHRELFDVVDLTAPHHMRAKLYALPRTTYDITAYIDADCEVQHEDISKMFDQIGDADIMLTKIRKYAAADVRISDTEIMTWHCGVFLYNNKDTTLAFMEDWWKEYVYQWDVKEWPWKDHREEMRPWDQYTFYRLYTSKKDETLKLEVFPGQDARWNFCHIYKPQECIDPPIIFHYTLQKDRINAGRFNKK